MSEDIMIILRIIEFVYGLICFGQIIWMARDIFALSEDKDNPEFSFMKYYKEITWGQFVRDFILLPGTLVLFFGRWFLFVMYKFCLVIVDVADFLEIQFSKKIFKRNP